MLMFMLTILGSLFSMRRLMLALALFAAVTCKAVADFPFLIIEKTDGSSFSLTAKGLEVKFDEGQMLFNSAEGTTQLEAKQLKRMYFSPQAVTGIHSLKARENTKVEVFDMTGKPVGNFASELSACKQLLPGLYVFKTNGVAQKIKVK